ncbi:MAG TPA: hypothetical protein VMV93_12960 [Chloroflexota bacterium]|nr:hypothetical protein [Chloroflexota bacterium]
MTLARSVADVLNNHVTLELACIDRMYLNLYVPPLQRPNGVAAFFRGQRQALFASSALMAPMTRDFVASIERFVKEQHLPLVTFKKGQRKDDVAAEYVRAIQGREGLLFVGKAQEKANVCRTEKRRNPRTGQVYPWIVRSSALVNQYYWYAIDDDFGPFFLKFCSYFPYTAKLYLNGHEYLKRQLAKEGIAFQALDNGLLSCADPARMQAIADELSPHHIQRLAAKWLARLPQPFSDADREAGYHYDLSILQAEFALTQVVDRPLTGRVFFEEVIRENLDLGRPKQVQLIFDRRVTKRTPGRFRTRVLTEGVTPSLHVSYKHADIKQYFKAAAAGLAGRAIRTELTVNDTNDFHIGKRLPNLPRLREVAFAAVRRMVQVERLSHDCAIGEDGLNRIIRPLEVNGQRAPALRFPDPRVQALFSVLVLFSLLPTGFAVHELRAALAPLLGWDPSHMTQGQLSYDLRRLRLHGLIARLPRSHRYQVTDSGRRSALLLSRIYARALRPSLSDILPQAPPGPSRLRPLFDQLSTAIDRHLQEAHLAA